MHLTTRLLALVPFFLFASLHMAGQSRLIDGHDGRPIAFAQIVDERGLTIGLTDADGRLPHPLKGSRLTVRHLAYKTEELDASALQAGRDIRLTPLTRTLGEAVVGNKSCEYVYLRTYFRSYQLNDSCLKYYMDGYADFLIRLRNGKAKRYITGLRRLKHPGLTQSDRQRAASATDKFLTLPYFDDTPLADCLSRCDQEKTGNGIRLIVQEGKAVGCITPDTSAHTLRIDYDVLGGVPHEGRLFGYTTRLENHIKTETYSYDGTLPTCADLTGRRSYRKLQYSHKKDTCRQRVEVTDELFVLERRMLPAREAKSLAKTAAGRNDQPVVPPGGNTVAPLDAATERTLREEMTADVR